MQPTDEAPGGNVDGASANDEITPAPRDSPPGEISNPFEPEKQVNEGEHLPENFYPLPIEVVHGQDATELVPTQDGASPEKTKSSRKKTILISVIIAIIILAIALGVGLGVGLKHNQASQASSVSSPPSSNSTPGSTQSILNDTSLAAVTNNDGNRHLFFQGFNGSLRHSSFDSNANTWLSSSDYVPTHSSPRNNTPVAVIRLEDPGPVQRIMDFLHVFYVDTNDLLTVALYIPPDADTNTPNHPTMNSSFSVAPSSRTLSLTKMTTTQSNTLAEALLMFEAPSGNITVLRGYCIGEDGSHGAWSWVDISQTINSDVSHFETWLAAPLGASVAPQSDPAKTQTIVISFSNPLALTDLTQAPLYQVGFGNWTGMLPNTTYEQSTSPNSIGPTSSPALFGSPYFQPNHTFSARNMTDYIVASDIIYLAGVLSNSTTTWGGAAWVGEQRLQYGEGAPTTAYPFARLAWLNDTSGSATRVYHQKDAGNLVEDVFYWAAGWDSNVIPVGD